eukprot:365207-Chlamydomonas_euryale.AAC.4
MHARSHTHPPSSRALAAVRAPRRRHPTGTPAVRGAAFKPSREPPLERRVRDHQRLVADAHAAGPAARDAFGARHQRLACRVIWRRRQQSTHARLNAQRTQQRALRDRPADGDRRAALERRGAQR